MKPKKQRRQNKKIAPENSISPRILAAAAIIFFAILAAVPFANGKRLEFATDDAFDGGLYVYTAGQIVDGHKIGDGVSTCARPATLLTNVISVAVFGYNQKGPVVLQMLMQLIALGLMFYALKKAYGILPAGVGLVLAAFYLSCPPYAKYGNVKEQFMIACMMIAVSSLMLRYLSGRFFWMIICGAFAVNAYYYKPTGVSAIIAIVIFIFALPLVKAGKFKDAGRDILLYFAGMIVGLAPLSIFYLWQGQLSRLKSTLPFVALSLITSITITIFVVYFAVRMSIKYRVLSRLKVLRQVSLKIWIIGLLLMAVAFASAVFYIDRGLKPYESEDQFIDRGEAIGFYVKSIPPVKFATRIVTYPYALMQRSIGLVNRAIQTAFPKSGYVAASREISDFKKQCNQVFGYFRSFVVPIGLSIFAIGCFLVTAVLGLIKNKKETLSAPVSPQDMFALLLTVWWIFDMLFVWVSPRAYVQYFLPLNASAAFLAGCAIYKCTKKQTLIAVMLGIILITQFIIYRLYAFTIGEPYQWSGFFKVAIPFVLAVVACFALKAAKFKTVRTIIFIVLCCIVLISSNTNNFKIFKDKLSKINIQGQTEWQAIGDYIKDKSSSDDGLYVWGWFPGIYVNAQRVCPVSDPAYSDMHSDPPQVVQRKIERLVADLGENPPLYIVDSQKSHFPFGEHPQFDLWPRWADKKNKRLQFQNRPGNVEPLAYDQLNMYRDLLSRQVRDYTYMLLTHAKHPGGPMEQSKAAERAKQEQLRHEAMYPLREFVMQNYQPLKSKGQMRVYKYKGK